MFGKLLSGFCGLLSGNCVKVSPLMFLTSTSIVEPLILLPVSTSSVTTFTLYCGSKVPFPIVVITLLQLLLSLCCKNAFVLNLLFVIIFVILPYIS